MSLAPPLAVIANHGSRPALMLIVVPLGLTAGAPVVVGTVTGRRGLDQLRARGVHPRWVMRIRTNGGV
jgi:hypothetical protein